MWRHRSNLLGALSAVESLRRCHMGEQRLHVDKFVDLPCSCSKSEWPYIAKRSSD